MRKITLVNQKGGCGKTMTAINLACFLADEGKQVLLIDLDPQGHSALGLGVRPEHIDKSIYEVLSGEIPIIDAIHTVRENLDAVFSNVVLSAFEQVMAGVAEREYKLAQSLADVEGYYSYLIIDSPPSVGLLTFNGLMASDEVIIPVDPSSFALHGLGKLLHTIQIIEEKIGHKLRVRILPTNVDLRTNFCKGVVETLKDRFPENCFRTIINTSTRLREAASFGKPIGEYDEHCTGFYDYEDLAEEIVSEEPARVVSPERRAEEQEVVFTLAAPENADVQIAGDFNNWEPESLDFADSQQGQVWQKAISLMPGSYQYKYLVGGDWLPDPENDKTVNDVFGGINSVVDV